MMADRKKLKENGLESYSNFFDKIENQYLNLIYDPIFNRVCERLEYEKTKSLMKWKCAICGTDILSDRNREDAENFVCERCKEYYNNKSILIDRRILDSRTNMFKYIEKQIYENLEDNLKLH